MADAQSKDFDNVTSFLGDYGRFQILMMVLLGISALPHGYTGMLAVFVSDTPEHRCRAPAPPLNATLNGSRVGPDSCSRYRVRGNWSEIGNDTEPCVDGWEYSTDTYVSTTVTEVKLSGNYFFILAQVTPRYSDCCISPDCCSGIWCVTTRGRSPCPRLYFLWVS